MFLGSCELDSFSDEENIYTVNFEMNGGSGIGQVSLNENDSFDINRYQVTKAGYVFDGWYIDEQFNEIFDGNLTQDITLYAKWTKIHTITWKNDDGSVLSTTEVKDGEMPTFTQGVPTKDATTTTIYTFNGWNPEVTLATKDIEYIATYSEEKIGSDTFDPSILNQIFGYDIYTNMSPIESSDYKIIDGTDVYGKVAYIDIFDWSEDDANEYLDILDTTYTYDETEEAWVLNEAYIYVYEDDETYPGKVVYGIGIYNYENDAHTSTDFSALNDIFGYDIYSDMPVIETSDFEIFDFSDSSEVLVYIDVFDWSENDSDEYITDLDIKLSYDETEEAWVIGNYYLYVYEDNQSYDETVYGVAIYGDPIDEALTWDDAIDALDQTFDYDSFDQILEVIDPIDDLTMNNSGSIIEVTSTYYNQTTTNMDTYLESLVDKGWVLDTELSQATYIYEVSTTKHFSLSVELNATGFKFTFSQYNPTIEAGETTTLSNLTSITDYEKSTNGFGGLPATGSYHVLVIPVEIKNYNFPSNYDSQLNLVFNGSAEDTGWQSVSSYYAQSSFNKLNITFDISEKYVTQNEASFYENYDDDGDQYVIREAMLALDDDIDFSQYDFNDDGAIDSVIFIYSHDYDDVDPWWAWVYDAEYGVADEVENIDGLDLEYYMWASYSFLNDSISGNNDLVVNAETYIHEMGHLLGFPDLYTNEYTYDAVGGWDMMSFNVGDHGPLNKILFNWVEPELMLNGNFDITLDAYSLDDDGLNSTVVIPYSSNAFDDGDAFDEFLIIMFYTPGGLYEGHMGTNESIDEPGVVIYRANATLDSYQEYWGVSYYYNNDENYDLFLEILEADKNNSIPSNNQSISINDLLTNGTLDLSYYTWQDGTSIDVIIKIDSIIDQDSTSVDLNIEVS